MFRRRNAMCSPHAGIVNHSLLSMYIVDLILGCDLCSRKDGQVDDQFDKARISIQQ